MRRFATATEPPEFDRAEAMRIAEAAVFNPGARLEPSHAGGRSRAGHAAALRQAVRDELEGRKRRLGVLTYDDLLTRLDDALDEPANVRRLQERYDVVLVDEFQDTDPIQWSILRRAFTGADTTLVLIGDPKQAIYAFRGADVHAYLAAARTAGASATLATNRRSDQALLDAFDALFANARLGHEGIVYRQARAAADRAACPYGGAPLRVRVVRRDEPSVALTAKGYAKKDSVVDHIAEDLAADVVGLLDREAALHPGDVAVLVRKNAHAAVVRDALAQAGVPAVINGAGSVFGTAPAAEWLRLLEALERPSQPSRARAAALTPFLGWSAEDVASAGDVRWEDVHRRLHHWARVLRSRGVAALAETVTLVEGLPARVLEAADGERRLTDLRHVAQLLHAAATAEQLGITALAGWLRRRIAEQARDTGDEERSRRLESDVAAVQVLTIHRSKGLEFPVVYAPFLWEPAPKARERVPVVFHDGDARAVDVGLAGSAYFEHQREEERELAGEDLRLAYVALTRAEHQAVLWWAGSYDTRDAPLTRLLFSRAEDGTVAPTGRSTPTDDEAWERLEALAAEAPGCVAVERSALGRPASWSAPLEPTPALQAAAFARGLDHGWRRTSYSDITAEAHEAWVGSEPEGEQLADEPPAPEEPAPGADPDGLPLAAMPAGARMGTVVHEVFEAVDFAAADLERELAAALAPAARRRGVELEDPAAVVAGLAAALRTPLGPLVDGRRLCDVAAADRLDELTFELPLVGGDDPSAELAVRAIGDVLRAHLPAGDPLAAYAGRLDDPALRAHVRGYLTGSIDLVVRLDRGARFAIADYKTNWLAPPGEPLAAAHHHPRALAAEMQRAHYGLQALLYTVALHRYLRWRLPGYAPEHHLAGVLYLFVRGMTGPDTPVADGTPHGVFAWKPPAALVCALSDVLDGGGR